MLRGFLSNLAVSIVTFFIFTMASVDTRAVEPLLRIQAAMYGTPNFEEIQQRQQWQQPEEIYRSLHNRGTCTFGPGMMKADREEMLRAFQYSDDKSQLPPVCLFLGSPKLETLTGLRCQLSKINQLVTEPKVIRINDDGKEQLAKDVYMYACHDYQTGLLATVESDEKAWNQGFKVLQLIKVTLKKGELRRDVTSPSGAFVYLSTSN